MTPSERRERLIQVLAKAPLNAQMQVDWEKLYAQYPGLREELGADTDAGRHRLSVMVAHLRKNKLVPNTVNTRKNKRVLNHPANRIATMNPTTKQQRAALYDEALDHPLWGKLTSREFFAQVPELAAKLGVVNEATLIRVASAIGHRKNHGRKNKRNSPLAAPTAPAPAQTIPPYTDGMPRCPGCGEDMAYWNQLYNARMNHDLQAHIRNNK